MPQDLFMRANKSENLRSGKIKTKAPSGGRKSKLADRIVGIKMGIGLGAFVGKF